MGIEFVQLREVDRAELIELMNHPLVLRHMPLASPRFDERALDSFLKAKERFWTDHGYGPWAIVENGKFIGWGGLQPEGSDTELALVLHPSHWGMGKVICREILRFAFEKLRLDSVIALFPPSRSHIKGLFHLGFEKDGEQEVSGHLFLRYRLKAQ